MADGEDTPTARPLRPAAPTFDGPPPSSRAAPTPPPPSSRAAPTPPPASPGPAPAPPLPTQRASTPDDPPPGTEHPTGATSDGIGRRRRIPFGRAARRIPTPWQLATGAVRGLSAWSRRPNGQLVLPALLLFALVAATGTAGALLIPAIAGEPHPRAADASIDPSVPGPAPTWLDATVPPTGPAGDVPPFLPPTDTIEGRPADVLTAWATQVGERITVSEVAMRAYGYAELVLAQTTPGCRLTWTTLAAIGLIESNHGRANGATLQPDGLATPHIIGLPLDGKGDRQRIMDTDGGQLDGDTVYDRAVGPMQFIPSTWRENGVDADNDGVKNPHDIDDAALAAGNYLCKGGRDLSTAQDWWNAILSYNDVRPYVQAVYDAANRYGLESRT